MTAQEVRVRTRSQPPLTSPYNPYAIPCRMRCYTPTSKAFICLLLSRLSLCARCCSCIQLHTNISNATKTKAINTQKYMALWLDLADVLWLYVLFFKDVLGHFCAGNALQQSAWLIILCYPFVLPNLSNGCPACCTFSVDLHDLVCPTLRSVLHPLLAKPSFCSSVIQRTKVH